MKFESKISITLASHILKTTTPIVLCGKLLPAGTFIDVSPLEAENVKSRGRAVDATTAEYSAAEHIFMSGTIDSYDEIIKKIRDTLNVMRGVPEFVDMKAVREKLAKARRA
jgi:hypothetical protein